MVMGWSAKRMQKAVKMKENNHGQYTEIKVEKDVITATA